ncbi:MAG: cytochrome c oxidase assembly protein [Thaumarchaeota archaeon]|nr:cytochrome c oxidase assembly protein [Nitrososphaerota archaeon]
MSDAVQIKATVEGGLSNRFLRMSILGFIVTLALLVGPVDSISDANLTVHMFQHIGLIICAGMVAYGIERYLGTHLVALRDKSHSAYDVVISLLKFNTKTRGLILGAVIPAIAISYWHFPSNFDLAVLNENVHVIEHLTYIMAGSLIGLSLVAIPSKIRIVLLVIAFMEAGMMGSMMLVWPYFYPVYSSAQNLQMDTALMLLGAFGVLGTSSWLLKALDIF